MLASRGFSWRRRRGVTVVPMHDSPRTSPMKPPSRRPDPAAPPQGAGRLARKAGAGLDPHGALPDHGQPARAAADHRTARDRLRRPLERRQEHRHQHPDAAEPPGLRVEDAGPHPAHQPVRARPEDRAPNALFADLPGYGYAAVARGAKLRWQQVMADYLSVRRSLSGVVLMVDSRHGFTDLDRQLLEFVGAARGQRLGQAAGAADQGRQAEQPGVGAGAGRSPRVPVDAGHRVVRPVSEPVFGPEEDRGWRRCLGAARMGCASVGLESVARGDRRT